MKPAFALDLDNDSVTLLQRSDGGWLRVGNVDFADGDLDGALARLRGRAEALAPEGFTSKLILPPSQVLYTEVDAPGPDRAARRATIAEALKGRTPYEVTELVFDFSRSGDRAKVAVVAQVTLDEAEGFAESHGFNPVCIVAVPKDGTFGGEPFFGLTARAGEHVPEGSHLDRDQEPVRVAGDAPALPEAVAVVVDTVAAPVADAAEPAAEAVAEAEPVVEATAEAEPTADAPSSGAKAPDEVQAGTAAEDLAAPAPTDDAEEAAPDLLDREAAPEATDAPAAAEGVAAVALPVLEAVAGRMQAARQAAEPAAPDAPDAPVTEDEAPFIAIDDAEEPEPVTVIGEAVPETWPETAPAAFQTRRAGARPEDEDDLLAAENRLHLTTADPVPDFAAAPVIEGVAAITAPELDVPPLLPEDDAADEGAARKRRTPPFGRPLLKSIPDAVHGTIAQQKLRHAGTVPPIATPALPAPPAPARPRKPAPARQITPAQGGKSGRVLLALTGILLAAMVTLGLASAWLSGADESTGAVAPAETGPALPAADDAATVDEAVPPSDSAELDPQPGAAPRAVDAAPEPDVSATDAAVADAMAETAAEVAAEPVVAAPAEVADTPPAPSPLPEADASGAPAIAQSPATPEGAEGPDALPDARTAASDAPPAPQPVPPPFGTVMQFDGAGMIVPTVDGVITPDGFTLFSGRPPKVPPPRPADALPAAAPASTDPAAPAPADPAAAAPGDGAALAPTAAPLPPADPALAAKKPRARPESIVAAATAAQQKANALAEAAAAAAKAEAERMASATAQAVTSSRRPANRPSGLVVTTSVQSAAVDAAVAAAVSEPLAAEPAAVPAPVAAPEPPPQPEVVAAAAPEPAPEPEPQAGTSFTDEVSEPEVQGTPNMPTTRTVAKQATIKNAINLSEVSLVGVYGSSSNRRALIRMPSGRFVKVKVGDRLDGGTIAAIGESEVSYVKRGRTIILKMAKSG
jgi:type IV pilus biogenesis protein PilP